MIRTPGAAVHRRPTSPRPLLAGAAQYVAMSTPAAPRTRFRIAALTAADAVLRREPFPFLVARQTLEDAARAELDRDFPRYAGAGFFPYADADCGPAVRELVAELCRPEVATVLGEQLGIERLGQYPTLVTLCRALNSRHGNIHTDSLSKVATALVYLNPDWRAGSPGSLRFLANATDIDALVAPELPPLYGNFAIFRRTDCSYHGHLPYEGERRVIQVAWVTSEDEKRRKTRRGRLSRVVKWLAGALDRRFGRRG